MICRFAIAILLAAIAAPTALAITGGVSVDDALDGAATPEIRSMASAIAEVTVPLIRVDAQGRTRALCTTTLVHPRVALTAAHCVFDGREIFDGLQVLFPAGGVPQRRHILDAVVHPELLAGVRAQGGDVRALLRKHGNDVLMNDLALVLLHRPAPDTHGIAQMVEPGFRDDRGIQKVIAGYGKPSAAASVRDLDLRFANLRGNTRDYRGLASGGGSEIVMESYYQDGEKVNVCSGDSGGPVFARERGGSRLRQIAVSSAADIQCRNYAIFAPVDAQRRALRRMFDDLMQGEQGADGNPF